MLKSHHFPTIATFIEKEFHPIRLSSSFIASIIATIITIIWAVSCSHLIFSGILHPYIPIGIGLVLVSNIITGFLIASRTSLPGIIPSIQEPPVAILSLIASTYIAQSSLDEIEITAFSLVVIMILTGLLSGLAFWLLGFFRLGSLVRYVPYPIIGGFLAGTGWLLVSNTVKNYADMSVDLFNFLALFSSPILFQWLPEFIFAFALLIILRYSRHCLVLPATILATIIIFYLFLGITGTSLEEARNAGWLMQPLPNEIIWKPLTISTFQTAHLSLIFQSLPQIASIILLGAIGLLLNISGLEVALKKDIALNHELKVTGVANILSGLMGGGLTSYVSLSRSILNHRLGASSRVVGWLLSGFCAIALFKGMSIITLLPEVLIGGLTIFLGLNFLVEWLYDSWWDLSKSDYFLVVLIVVAIALIGLLQGIILGLVIAMAFFVIKSSRLSIIKSVSNLANCSSHVQRSSLETKVINKQGDSVYILQLQGWLFFGTANQLFNQIRNRMKKTQQDSIRFVVLDFRLVSGLDSSALVNFIKIQQLIQGHSASLILTNVMAKEKGKLAKKINLESSFIYLFDELNEGLAWCEEELLSLYYPPHKSCPLLESQLRNYFPPSVDVSLLMGYLKHHTLSAGEFLFNQGQLSLGMYFLELGELSVVKKLSSGQTKHLRTYKSETILGEMGFYSQSNHSASVIAEQHSSVYFLSSHEFKRMEKENPQLASVFHKFIIKLLIERIQYREADLQNLLS